MNKKRKIFIIVGVIFFLLLLGGGCFLFTRKQKELDSPKEEEKKEYSVAESISLEYGSSLPVLTDFLDDEVEGTIEIYYDGTLVEEEVLHEVGEYDVRILIDDVVYSSKIIVKDVEKPKLVLKKVEITTDDSYTVSSFVSSCEDNSKKDCILAFDDDQMGNYKDSGTYTITVIAKDESGNEEKQTTQLVIKQANRTSTSPTSSSSSTKTTSEVKTSVSYKYGVKITSKDTIYYTVLSDGTKKETKRTSKKTYDRSSFNATTQDMLSEAKSQVTAEKSNINAILKATNKYREELGLDPLVLDTTLTQAANVRAIEMAWGNKVAHERPDGTSCFTIFNDFGFTSFYSGENIAYGQANGTKAATWWRNSTDHYANMTNPYYTKIGIGVYKFDGKYYYVQLFSS